MTNKQKGDKNMDEKRTAQDATKKHAKQPVKPDEVKVVWKDAVERSAVLGAIQPALIRVRRNGVTMQVREVIALLNGIIADVENL